MHTRNGRKFEPRLCTFYPSAISGKNYTRTGTYLNTFTTEHSRSSWLLFLAVLQCRLHTMHFISDAHVWKFNYHRLFFWCLYSVIKMENNAVCFRKLFENERWVKMWDCTQPLSYLTVLLSELLKKVWIDIAKTESKYCMRVTFKSAYKSQFWN